MIKWINISHIEFKNTRALSDGRSVCASDGACALVFLNKGLFIWFITLRLPSSWEYSCCCCCVNEPNGVCRLGSITLPHANEGPRTTRSQDSSRFSHNHLTNGHKSRGINPGRMVFHQQVNCAFTVVSSRTETVDFGCVLRGSFSCICQRSVIYLGLYADKSRFIRSIRPGTKWRA